MEDEDFYFSCTACSSEFPAEPNAVVQLSKSVYLIDKTRPMDNTLSWEGVGEINNVSGDFCVEQIFSDTEMSNSSIILCKKCRIKYKNCN